ncbi:hydroxyethylthiazole kinase [Herbaspirillum rubrisubalbicans Os34]|uniref:Hydroxyethylthiazole kinase n=1 Tax=Herbaspirillum rubrisubalbicans Os34 TaxID=1235827 RepID=A0A6M3ZMY0_9BURK|nr:M23 family metallopeptidase [Herbaspirillum rubrisubalbicans]QJP99928.1 hydroxyethylthiazole kinase [Herbaspirillum rubrisubalbicans Os34]
MLISPPFLPMRTAHQTEDEWLDIAMNGDAPGKGAFPVSFNLGWHGGIHLTSPKSGNAHEPVRAIADGTVVLVRPSTKGLPNLPPEHPLMYNGATSDGVVVMRHEVQIGEGEQATAVFFSIYMHLHEIAPTTVLNKFVHRKEVIGGVGYINGERGRMHFEIVCDDANLTALAGRSSGTLPLASDGRVDAIFGEIYFYLPAGTPVFGEEPLANFAQAMTPAPPPRRPSPDKEADPPVALAPVHVTTSDTLLGVRYPGAEGNVASSGEAVVTLYGLDGARIGTALKEKDGEADLYKNAVRIAKACSEENRPAPSAVYELLRFGRVIGPDPLPSPTLPHWRKMPYPGGQGWVNLNAANIRKFSDADFPHWKQWRLIDDDTDQDSRCDSSIIRGWLDTDQDGRVQPDEAMARLANTENAARLRKVVARFPTEWESSTIDARWGWLKGCTRENATPLSSADFDALRAHIKALAFWPGDTDLPRIHWHWHPKEFIRHFRKCAWLSAKDLARIYPDNKYPLKALEAEGRQRTPASIRETYRNDINKVMRKYLINSPVRMTHFLGEAAVECMYLLMMAEGSVSFARKPTHESFLPEDAGFYMPKAKTDYLYYLSGRLGNIEEHDGPKFRGRGIKQLTGRENYGKYWVYRGWLSPTSFEATWWKPSNPEKAPRIPDPQRLSISSYNAVDSGGWYWTAGARDNKFKTINLIVKALTVDIATVKDIAAAINGINRTTEKPNHLDERLKETLWAKQIIMDDTK